MEKLSTVSSVLNRVKEREEHQKKMQLAAKQSGHLNDPYDITRNETTGCPHCGSYEGDWQECPECGHGQ